MFRRKKKDLKLTIELVPSTAWWSNVRQKVSQSFWDTIRRRTYWEAGYFCKICGGQGDRWPVECHEIWEYDEATGIQKLTGFIALCPPCHSVKHYGYAIFSGNSNLAFEHFCKVNDLKPKEAKRYIEEAFQQWERRSRFSWETDVSLLNEYIK